MELQIGKFKVRDVQFTGFSRYENGILYINKLELIAEIKDDTYFEKVDIEIVRPGESARIIHVLDTVQPRYKVSEGNTFPGMTEKARPVGFGVTHCLEGASVVVSCEREKGLGNIVHESIIEMNGPGAKYNLFSSLFNIVIHCESVKNLDDAEFARATRLAGLKAAEYLAETTKGLTAESVERFQLDCQPNDNLPGIAYIYLVQSQGYLRQTFVYGKDMSSSLPVLLHPNEILDGALVSGNYVIGAQKNPTFLHLNNPVILDLMQRHGKEVNFVGVIVANEHSLLEEKERSAVFAARYAKMLSADGVIITKEGGGNTYTDLMLNCRECEKLGIKTVIITNEVAGPHGDQPPLVDSIPEADTIVSTGNMDESITLGSVTKVVGGEKIDGTSCLAQDSFTTGLGMLYTSTNPLGQYKLTATRD